MDPKNTVTLYIDDSDLSKTAESILQDSRISYEIVPSTGPGLPSARLANTLYSGLNGVTLLARGQRDRVTR